MEVADRQANDRAAQAAGGFRPGERRLLGVGVDEKSPAPTAASSAARWTAVVVFPVPPFRLAIAMRTVFLSLVADVRIISTHTRSTVDTDLRPSRQVRVGA